MYALAGFLGRTRIWEMSEAGDERLGFTFEAACLEPHGNFWCFFDADGRRRRCAWLKTPHAQSYNPFVAVN